MWRVMRRLLAWQAWTPGATAVLVVAWTVQVGALLPVPLVVRELLDGAIPDGDRGRLWALGATLLGLQLVSLLGSSVARQVAFTRAWSAGRRLRDALLTDLYRRSLGSARRRSTDEVHDVLVQHTDRLDRNGVAPTVQVLPPLVTVIAIGTLLLFIDWRLWVTTAAFSPVFVLVSRRLSAAVQRRTRAYHDRFGEVGGETHRRISILETTLARGATGQEEQEAAEQHRRLADAGRRAQWQARIQADVLQSVVAVAVVVTLLVGGSSVIDGRLTLGTLFSFYAGLALVRLPLTQLSAGLPALTTVRESLEVVERHLAEATPEPYRGTGRPHPDRGLALEGVTFSYDGEHRALDGVDLRLDPGRITALTGPNGSGKTTIVALLLGLHRPDHGRLRVGDDAYDDVDIVALRSHLGVVFQEPVLLPATVRENLVYGRPGTTESEIGAALSASTADRVIAALPDGLDTVLGPGHTTLSGGQRQRVAIARALIGRPDVLLLDEPTNHLDRRSVAEVLTHLQAAEHPPSVLLISHDVHAIAIADRIVHLDGGRVVRVEEPEPTGGGR